MGFNRYLGFAFETYFIYIQCQTRYLAYTNAVQQHVGTDTQALGVFRKIGDIQGSFGQQFCAAARESGANMPIIILSAASPSELGWTSGLSGPNAWLRKPFKPAALVHDIARIVEEHREPIA